MKMEYAAQILRGWPADGSLERAETINSSATLINGNLVEMQSDGTVAPTSITNTRKAGLVIRGNGDSGSAKLANEALTLWGNYVVATTSFDATRTYVPGSPITVSNGNYTLANGAAGAVQASTSITEAANIATYTTAAAHGYLAGQVVTITGTTPAAYSGTFTILSVPTPTTFTYTVTGSPVTATVQGSAVTAVDPEIGYVLQNQGTTAFETAHLTIVVY